MKSVDVNVSKAQNMIYHFLLLKTYAQRNVMLLLRERLLSSLFSVRVMLIFSAHVNIFPTNSFKICSRQFQERLKYYHVHSREELIFLTRTLWILFFMRQANREFWYYFWDSVVKFSFFFFFPRTQKAFGIFIQCICTGKYVLFPRDFQPTDALSRALLRYLSNRNILHIAILTLRIISLYSIPSWRSNCQNA